MAHIGDWLDYFGDNKEIKFVLCQWNYNATGINRYNIYCPICEKHICGKGAWTNLINHENAHLDKMGIDPTGKYGDISQIKPHKTLAEKYVESFGDAPRPEFFGAYMGDSYWAVKALNVKQRKQWFTERALVLSEDIDVVMDTYREMRKSGRIQGEYDLPEKMTSQEKPASTQKIQKDRNDNSAEEYDLDKMNELYMSKII